MILINPVIRTDKYGDGSYQAPRGVRKHDGIDYHCPAGSLVVSNCTGVVNKIGRPYYIANPTTKKDNMKNEYRYVQVFCDDGVARRFFYIEPVVELCQKVNEGDPLGFVQPMFIEGMKDHLHFECEKDGVNIDPRDYL